MTFEEAKALALGYAWAMEDAGKGAAFPEHGSTGADRLAFAFAYATAHVEYGKGTRNHMPPVREAWKHWQESRGRTIDDQYMTAPGLARRISRALISSAEISETAVSGTAVEVTAALGQRFTVTVISHD